MGRYYAAPQLIPINTTGDVIYAAAGNAVFPAIGLLTSYAPPNIQHWSLDEITLSCSISNPDSALAGLFLGSFQTGQPQILSLTGPTSQLWIPAVTYINIYAGIASAPFNPWRTLKFKEPYKMGPGQQVAIYGCSANDAAVLFNGYASIRYNVDQ